MNNIKQRLLFYFKYAAIWFIYFIAIKILFLVVNYHQSFPVLNLWPKIILKGILLDTSVLGYLMVLPSLIFLAGSIFPGKWIGISLKSYTYFLLVFMSIIAIADLVIYPEWGFRLDITPLYYMENLKGAAASLTFWQIILFIFFSLLLSAPFLVIFNRLFITLEYFQRLRFLWASPVFLFLLGFLFLPIRGGVGTAPINTGSVYFSSNTFVNHASLNVFWNILYSVTNMHDYDNPFNFYSKDKINRYYSSASKDSLQAETQQILTTTRPNILIIILESFTANAIGSLNPKYSVTKNLDKIANEGILFTHFYATGDRSDKGLISILSGYPAQPTTSIIKYPNKTEKLPGLPTTLKKYGYSSTYYYGGDIDFANMRSYLVNIGFEKIISQVDFKAKQRICSWGVPDEFLFNRVLNDIHPDSTPYLKVMFTLSSHRPFDVPGDKVWVKGDDKESMFLNSIAYTDYYLSKFLDALSAKGALENTLVVMVADHGSLYPGPISFKSKDFPHIPLILYGPALKEKGIKYNKIGSQVDIVATILAQMKIDHSEYIFSHDLFSKNAENEAFYAFHKGFGYLSPNVELQYTMMNNKMVATKGLLTDSVEMKTKIYYQHLYENFLSLN